MKIVFFGTSDFAVPALQALHQEGHAIVAVITIPDKPVGRKKILTPSPIKVAARKLGLDVLQPESLKIGEFENYLKIENFKLKIQNMDLGIVASYGKIIPPEMIKLFLRGLINIHPSLLPKYRGASPIQSAILSGENETGITIMLLDQELDHGPVISKTNYALSPLKYFTEIKEELAQGGAKLLTKTLSDYWNGKITPQEQDHSLATVTKKFSLADGKINWQKSAKEIFNQIRALNPEPGTWTTRKDRPQEILKILRASPLPQTARYAPGTVLIENHTLLVSTGEGTLQLEEVQPSGKKAMSTTAFINGRPDFISAQLS